MSEKIVVSILWVIAACMFIGWLAGLVSLSLNEQDWSHVTPAPVKTRTHTCNGRDRGAWCL